jgi:hypothetical protein
VPDFDVLEFFSSFIATLTVVCIRVASYEEDIKVKCPATRHAGAKGEVLVDEKRMRIPVPYGLSTNKKHCQ